MRSGVSRPRRSAQRGAFSILLALGIVVLLAFAGLAIDMGRGMLVRSEMKTATDACALAAVTELDGQSDADARAVAAGTYMASRNKSVFQKVATVASVTPSYQGASTSTTEPSNTVECTATYQGFVTTLLGVVGITAFDIKATSTATLGPSQIGCLIPMAICAGSDATPANWTTKMNLFGQYEAGDPAVDVSGAFYWVLPPDTGNGNGASRLRAAFGTTAACGGSFIRSTDSGTTCNIIVTGVRSTVMAPFNTRFGIYPNGNSEWTTTGSPPDLSGYGYAADPVAAGDIDTTDTSLIATDPSGNRLFDSATTTPLTTTATASSTSNKTPTPSCPTSQTNSTTGATCPYTSASTPTCTSKKQGNTTTYTCTATCTYACPSPRWNYYKDFLKNKVGTAYSSFQYNADISGANPLSSASLKSLGQYNRRLATVAVVKCPSTCADNKTKTVVGYACVFLLAPFDNNSKKGFTDPRVLYIGDASKTDSPCRAAGLPRSNDPLSPLVPVLVR
ncbi:MAG: pilus assembly protein TadG-related protein [Chakrabartia sp.]